MSSMTVQTNIADVKRANKFEGFKPTNIIDAQLQEIKIFSSIMPEEMAELQMKDNQLSMVYECVAANLKPKLSEIHRVRSNPVCRLLLQFDRLSLI